MLRLAVVASCALFQIHRRRRAARMKSRVLRLLRALARDYSLVTDPGTTVSLRDGTLTAWIVAYAWGDDDLGLPCLVQFPVDDEDRLGAGKVLAVRKFGKKNGKDIVDTFTVDVPLEGRPLLASVSEAVPVSPDEEFVYGHWPDAPTALEPLSNGAWAIAPSPDRRSLLLEHRTLAALAAVPPESWDRASSGFVRGVLHAMILMRTIGGLFGDEVLVPVLRAARAELEGRAAEWPRRKNRFFKMEVDTVRHKVETLRAALSELPADAARAWATEVAARLEAGYSEELADALYEAIDG